MSNLLYADLYYVMGQLGPVWPALAKKRVFLTGGSGFVGTWMAETFAFANNGLELEAEMTILSRREDFVSHDPAVKIVRGDVRDFEFPEGQYDYIIHAAADYMASPAESFDISVRGTQRVLEFAKKCGAKRLVFTSSGAVYRTDPANPAHAYGAGKIAAEMLCSLAHEEDGLHTHIARLFGFVGPCLQLDRHFAIGKFIREGLAGGPIVVKGGANVVRSYLYAAEMATAPWMMLLWDKSSRIYNVGSSEGISIAALAMVVADVCGCKMVQEEGEYPDDVYLPPPGPKANIGLREAIERTVAWHREQEK